MGWSAATGTADEDRQEIQQHTDEQDEYLDKIHLAVQGLRVMSEVSTKAQA
jgi:hypothetical protein